ncbi:MAG: cobalt ECF transporter T component CbiQ [Candidatus Aureabacteria bacterium]|nr:cobalt ECF transporter T component CbiQ [Candidatus Auribacterota bacterium]
MTHHLFSPYSHQSSPVHRAPPVLKLAAAVIFVFAVVLVPRTASIAYAAAGALLAALAVLSRVPPLYLAKRLLMVEPFAVGVALLALLQKNGAGIFAAMLAKSTLCLSAMVLLTTTTRFSDLLRALWRARAPALLVTTLALMHRYLFLLFDEMGRMFRARKSRSFSGNRFSAWRSSATVLALLFVRSSERAERVYAAMCARGWKT